MSEPLSAQGRSLLDAGAALEAVDVLRRAVAAGEPSAADLLVAAYLDSGSWRAAVEWLAPLVAQGTSGSPGRLGVAYAEIGDVEDAEDALRLALEHGELIAANDLAILLRDDGRVGEAVLLLARAAEEGDEQAPANLVAVHLENGDLVAAAEAAHRYADEARPDSIVALADVLAAQSRFEEAERTYRRAGELGGVRAHTAYGQFLLSVLGDAAAAEREFREAQRHNEPGWAWTLGRFLVDDGRPDEARDYLEVAVGWGDRTAAALLAELDGVDDWKRAPDRGAAAGVDGVRTYGAELAVLAVTGRRAQITTAGTLDELDVGEEIGARAVVNRVVAALPGEVGLVAVTTRERTWAPGALDLLVRAAARHPRAGLLGPAGASGWLDGAGVLLRRAAWDSVDGYASRIADPRRADVDFAARLTRAGWLVVAVPEVLVHPLGTQGMLSG